MHRLYSKFQSQNAQTFGYVYQSTNGQNPGPVWMTQSFLLNEICTVILWQDYHGNGNLRKFYWKTDGKKFQIGNACSLTESKDYSCLCTWTRSKWQDRNKIWIQCGKYSWKRVIWESQHHSSTMFIWVALKVNVEAARILWIFTDLFESRIFECSHQGFLPGQWKIFQKQKPQWNLMPKLSLHGPISWLVMQRSVWNDIVSWETRRLNQIIQSRDTMYWRSSTQRRRNGISWRIVNSLPTIFYNMPFLGRIGRPDILWSVNKFARAITKWTRACDKRLARLISYIHHTYE